MINPAKLRVFYTCAGFVALLVIGRTIVGRPMPAPPHGAGPSSISAHAKALPEKNAKSGDAEGSGPQKVTLGLYIADVHDVDLREATFASDFYLWMRYPKQKDESTAKEIEKIEFVNGKSDPFDEQDRKTVGNEVYVCWKVHGVFRYFPALQNYPFDKQYLTIQIEHASMDNEALTFEDDHRSYDRYQDVRSRWGIKESLFIPEYELSAVDRSVVPAIYNSDFGDPSRKEAQSVYSHYEVGISLSRMFAPFFFKIVLPLFVTLAMAYLVFYLPPKEIQSATGLAMSALLSCFACNVSVTQNLPSVGYLVTSDKLFICTYVMLFLNLAESIVTYNLYEDGKEAKALVLDRYCQITFPILYAASFGYLVAEALMYR